MDVFSPQKWRKCKNPRASSDKEMINEERFWQKKLLTRKPFGRKIDQRGKNLAEKLINEEFPNKIVENPR